MPQSLSVLGPAEAPRHGALPPFLCTWRAGSCAAWVQVAGTLNAVTSPRLKQALEEAQLNARLLMLDLRELSSIDGSAVRVILDAAVRARRRGGRLIVARGPSEVDRVLTLRGACDHLLIVDLDPAEPAAALLEVAAAAAAQGRPRHLRILRGRR